MRKVDVCLSPELLKLYNLEERIVVVVDVLRATSCMVTAIANGVRQIQTFSNAEACLQARKAGYIIAGERNGEKLPDFDLGNSPYHYVNEALLGEKIAMTTTNGTIAIEESRHAKHVIIGAFLNLTAVANEIKSRSEDVIILCAAWKGKVNLEDTLFAGALVNALRTDFKHECDAPQLAETAWLAAKDDLKGYLSESSHFKRLSRLGIEKDIDFCLQVDHFDEVPCLKGDYIMSL